MIAIPFWLGEAVFTLVWVVVRLFVWKRQDRINWKREAVLLLMYINLAVLLRFTFYPMARVDGKVQPLIFDVNRVFPFWINFVPFVHLDDYVSRREMIINFIGNIAMFIPSGIVLPIVYRRLDHFRKVVGAGFLISLCIEILQLPFVGRSSDIDDLILNTSGVAIGYGIYALVRALVKPKRKR